MGAFFVFWRGVDKFVKMVIVTRGIATVRGRVMTSKAQGLPKGTHYVYAFCLDGAWGGLELAIKIGVSSDPSRRLEQMQTGSPVPIINKKMWHFNNESDARSFEKACHKNFKEANLKREWFLVTIDQIDEFLYFYEAAKNVTEEFEDVHAELKKMQKSKEWIDFQTRNTQNKVANRLEQIKEKAGVQVESKHEKLMTTLEAAKHIDKSASWLNKSRMTGTGPIYVKAGGNVRYRREDLDAWILCGRRTAIYDFNNSAAL